MRRLFILAMAIATLMTVAVGIASAGPAPKVDVCHYDADAGTFHLINISENAFDAHIDHGDRSPGEAVPGMPGYEFDSVCDIVPTVESGFAELTAGWEPYTCADPGSLPVEGRVDWSAQLSTLTVTYTVFDAAPGTSYSVGFSTESVPPYPMVTGSAGDYEAAIWGPYTGNCGGSLSQYLTRFATFTTPGTVTDVSYTVVIDVVPGTYDTQFYLTRGGTWSPVFKTGDFVGDYVTVVVPGQS